MACIFTGKFPPFFPCMVALKPTFRSYVATATRWSARRDSCDLIPALAIGARIDGWQHRSARACRRRWCENQSESGFRPFPGCSDNAIGDRHAEAGHEVDDLAGDLGFGL